MSYSSLWCVPFGLVQIKASTHSGWQLLQNLTYQRISPIPLLFLREEAECVSFPSALRVTLCAHDKEQKIFGTICYLLPPHHHHHTHTNQHPHPSPLLKIMNSEPHSHSCAQPSEEAPPLPSWANSAQSSLIILIPDWPIARFFPAHMTPFCALTLLSTLNPGECRHHWRPDTGAIGRPLTSAESTGRYLIQTLSPSDEADRSVDENDPASPEERTFSAPSPNDRRGVGARQ